MLTPQIMLSKMLEKNAIMFSAIVTIFRYRGFFDSMFLRIEEIWSMNLRNLKILRVFFMVARSLKATLAPAFLPALNLLTTEGISEYLLQL